MVHTSQHGRDHAGDEQPDGENVERKPGRHPACRPPQISRMPPGSDRGDTDTILRDHCRHQLNDLNRMSYDILSYSNLI